MRSNLAQLKNDANLTWRQLSRKTEDVDPAGEGVSERHLRAIASGDADPSVGKALLIAGALDVSIERIFEIDEVKV